MSNVRDYGACGDGTTDDTNAIVHTLHNGNGTLEFPPGDYRITRTIRIELHGGRRFGIDGSMGAAKLIIAGAGPAFHIIGTHEKTADPATVTPQTWISERMPLAQNLEVVGQAPDAAGFLLEGTMQATFAGVLLRRLVYAVRLSGRARNLLVSHCHIYDNRAVGIDCHRVNLHQAIITGSHISYCKQAGIRIVGSEVRNLQITGNDIEYNFDAAAQGSADILIDASADGSSVREGTIVGNTIQARYSPGGANVRLIGRHPKASHKAGMFTISNNLIGSQEINVHLVACRGVVVSGNVMYSGHRRNLQVDGSRNIAVGINSFDHNPDYQEKELCTGLRLADSEAVTVNGLLIHDCRHGQHTVEGAQPIVREGLVEIVRCNRVSISGCQVLDGTPYGIFLEDASDVAITGSTVLDSRRETTSRAMIRWKGTGHGNLLAHNRLGRGVNGVVEIDAAADVAVEGNRQ